MSESPQSSAKLPSLAVIGSGPAGLMAADQLAQAGYSVTLIEKRKALGWKLYIAGSSGLNISNALPLDVFAGHYTGPAKVWQRALQSFSPESWIRFIEEQLGLGTFLGTSGRYFVETMHAAKLLKLWRKRLESLGVSFSLGETLTSLRSQGSGGVELGFASGRREAFDACVLALGGGSYASIEEPVLWPSLFLEHSLSCVPFSPSNTGYTLAWSAGFLAEADGKPLKNIELLTTKGSRRGDLVVTQYGLEGTPIYFLGEPGLAHLDLKPDLSLEEVQKRLQKSKENLSPLRRAKKYLNLCEASLALLFHESAPEARSDIEALAQQIKSFPLQLQEPRPLAESISSRGGVAWEELDENYMLKRLPHVYCLGEMIDWDAPTGGFLIQGCVSQAFDLANRLKEILAKDQNTSSNSQTHFV